MARKRRHAQRGMRNPGRSAGNAANRGKGDYFVPPTCRFYHEQTAPSNPATVAARGLDTEARIMPPTGAALAAAIALSRGGFACFPVARIKHPTTRRGFLDATSDPAALSELWRRSPGPLVGVRTGEASGIDALDI